MRHIIIGTAGHVDHGKTSLIRALTGLDTDRLPEEKERGLTIELGFAPFKLQDGTKIGVIDVPGHEKFIKNMLAGITSIDLVLFVIALDEGIMPQTEEHLNIIDLLGIRNGLVVLTKADLVDEEIIEMVKEDVEKRFQNTSLSSCPIVTFSATTGEGLSELVSIIQDAIKKVASKEVTSSELSGNLVRMPIDRVFSKSGHGTIITGTLVDGIIRNGDKLEVMPEGKGVRVRQIQVHDEVVEEAIKGQRVALNLAGVDKEDIEKGMVISSAGSLEKSTMLDVELSVIRGSEPVLNRQRLRLHHGSSEVMCRIRTIGKDAILPGERAFAQLELESELAAVHSDRFIIRTYSPPTTIGGGRILFSGSKRLRRLDEGVVSMFTLLASDDVGEVVDGCFYALKLQEKMSKTVLLVPIKVQDLAKNLAMREDIVQKVIDAKVEKSEYSRIDIGVNSSDGDNTYYATQKDFDDLSKDIVKRIEKFHIDNQLEEGMTREELRTRYYAYLEQKTFYAILNIMGEKNQISLNGNNVASQKAKQAANPDVDGLIKDIEDMYISNLFTPPDKTEVVQKSKNSRRAEEIFKFLVNSKKLMRVGPEMFFHYTAIDEACKIMKELDASPEGFTLAQFRDATNTSRKYAMVLLEYFDGQKKTKRVGDFRKYIG